MNHCMHVHWCVYTNTKNRYSTPPKKKKNRNIYTSLSNLCVVDTVWICALGRTRSRSKNGRWVFDTTILASFAGVTATLLETQLWPMNAWGNSFSDSRVLRDAESM